MNRNVAPDAVFYSALRSEDALGAVIRAHIHIEARLTQFIETIVVPAEHLPRLHYEQRAHLAVALGIDPGLLPALKAMVDELYIAFGERRL